MFLLKILFCGIRNHSAFKFNKHAIANKKLYFYKSMRYIKMNATPVLKKRLTFIVTGSGTVAIFLYKTATTNI